MRPYFQPITNQITVRKAVRANKARDRIGILTCPRNKPGLQEKKSSDGRTTVVHGGLPSNRKKAGTVVRNGKAGRPGRMPRPTQAGTTKPHPATRVTALVLIQPFVLPKTASDPLGRELFMR